MLCKFLPPKIFVIIKFKNECNFEKEEKENKTKTIHPFLAFHPIFSTLLWEISIISSFSCLQSYPIFYILKETTQNKTSLEVLLHWLLGVFCVLPSFAKSSNVGSSWSVYPQATTFLVYTLCLSQLLFHFYKLNYNINADNLQIYFHSVGFSSRFRLAGQCHPDWLRDILNSTY